MKVSGDGVPSGVVDSASREEFWYQSCESSRLAKHIANSRSRIAIALIQRCTDKGLLTVRFWSIQLILDRREHSDRKCIRSLPDV